MPWRSGDAWDGDLDALVMGWMPRRAVGRSMLQGFYVVGKQCTAAVQDL